MRWNPTSKTLDSMSRHSEREMRNIIRSDKTGYFGDSPFLREPRKLHHHHFHAIMAAVCVAMATIMLWVSL